MPSQYAPKGPADRSLAVPIVAALAVKAVALAVIYLAFFVPPPSLVPSGLERATGDARAGSARRNRPPYEPLLGKVDVVFQLGARPRSGRLLRDPQRDVVGDRRGGRQAAGLTPGTVIAAARGRRQTADGNAPSVPTANAQPAQTRPADARASIEERERRACGGRNDGNTQSPASNFAPDQCRPPNGAAAPSPLREPAAATSAGSAANRGSPAPPGAAAGAIRAEQVQRAARRRRSAAARCWRIGGSDTR